jgi:hypothetical protein
MDFPLLDICDDALGETWLRKYLVRSRLQKGRKRLKKQLEHMAGQ